MSSPISGGWHFFSCQDNSNGRHWEPEILSLVNNSLQNLLFILSGITEDDYIAYPDYELCVEGAPTTKVQQTQDVTLEGFSAESVVLG